MAKSLKVYIAGKVSKDSVFGTSHWRDAFCEELEKKIGQKVINLDPTRTGISKVLDEKDYQAVVGRDCFLIQNADVVIVNLTNDISVGGSQEMLIAKYFKKPLIGIAPLGGKFRKPEKEIYGKVYNDYTDPFVYMSCDRVVEDLDELATVVQGIDSAKQIGLLDEATQYYKESFYPDDELVQKLGL